ncbi:unnamed protein product [Caenorhabditis sp. 36 PRJEB53466]|nr:unnamed protein product [Caenorhabditis sp. 36 PRJEB53466]
MFFSRSRKQLDSANRIDSKMASRSKKNQNTEFPVGSSHRSQPLQVPDSPQTDFPSDYSSGSSTSTGSALTSLRTSASYDGSSGSSHVSTGKSRGSRIDSFRSSPGLGEFLSYYSKQPDFEAFSISVDGIPFVAVSLGNADDQLSSKFMKKAPPPTPMKRHTPGVNSLETDLTE